MRENTVRKILIYVFVCIIAVLLVMQVNYIFVTETDRVEIESIDDIDGHNIGVLMGASYSKDTEKTFPKSKISYYTSYSEMIQDLKSGRIDAYIVDRPMAKAQQREATGIKPLDGSITNDKYAFVLSTDNKKLCEELNYEIEKLREEGELDKLADKWIEEGGRHSISSSTNGEHPKGTLRVATNADSAPFSYNYNGDIVGYDVELLSIAADRLGYSIQTTQYAFGSLLNSITSGKEDIAVGGITVTDERSQAIIFTDEVYDGGTCAVIIDEKVESNLAERVWNGIYRMLILEDRWKQILAGIGVTILISLVTLFVGSPFGVGLSILMRSENKRRAKVSNTYSKIISNLPLLIILMILYYVIFAKQNIPAIVVAIIGFVLVFSNTVANLLNTGLLAVDKGQLEAATAMGYRKKQVFLKVAFPQIVKQMNSQYIGAVTSMIKDTSIVGFITVQDLTNVSDTIRSSTYQAFFPLLFTAIVYFVIAELIVKLLSMVMSRYVMHSHLVGFNSSRSYSGKTTSSSVKGGKQND